MNRADTLDLDKKMVADQSPTAGVIKSLDSYVPKIWNPTGPADNSLYYPYMLSSTNDSDLSTSINLGFVDEPLNYKTSQYNTPFKPNYLINQTQTSGYQTSTNLQRNHSEPLMHPTATNARIGKLSMNINAQSYTPSYVAGTPNSTTRASNDYTASSTSNISSHSSFSYDSDSATPLQNSYFGYKAPTTYPSQYQLASAKPAIKSTTMVNKYLETKLDKSSIDQMKLELSVKENLIAKLTEQLNSLKNFKSNNLSNDKTNSLKVPNNYYQLFKDLTNALNERTMELEDTKQRLESLMVSCSVTNSNTKSSITVNGQFDEQELTHKIVNKLATLLSENESLLKMISYSNKLSLLVELGLLRNENENLKSKD